MYRNTISLHKQHLFHPDSYFSFYNTFKTEQYWSLLNIIITHTSAGHVLLIIVLIQIFIAFEFKYMTTYCLQWHLNTFLSTLFFPILFSSSLTLFNTLQVYKVSQFEQKLMSEIEYRLEQTPPVIELPEDNMYEDVEPGNEVTKTVAKTWKCNN